MSKFYRLYFVVLIINVTLLLCKDVKSPVIDNIEDVKEFKKLLRTKTNVLVCFTNSAKQAAQVIKVIKETADILKGQATMVTIECSGETKKLCKKLKVTPDSYILKHYKNGVFNKDYDRKLTTSSMVNFMRDPTGDLPWEEDSTAVDIIHISDPESLTKFIKQESKPAMVMFYAPWCGFCKTLKPEYVSAAKELKSHSVLAAIDVNKPENAAIRTQYNITGFPTLLYFKNGVMKYQYEGNNKKDDIISFMKNPQPVTKEKEKEWSEEDSDVVYLTSANFKPVTKEEASLLIMFYAPWCPHCKKVKPEYEQAAAIMKKQKIPGMLAAIDATKEPSIADEYKAKGYPTFKFFSYGEFKFDINSRTSKDFVEFMKNPKQPPPPPPPTEEIPWSDEESHVVHLDEENFKSFLKKKRHVLVMFYAPWCGHCKKTKPEFVKVAEYYKDDPKIELAAIDCTIEQNLCQQNGIKGYPTIKYYNFYKNSQDYSYGRREEDFIAFINQLNKSTENKMNLEMNKEL